MIIANAKRFVPKEAKEDVKKAERKLERIEKQANAILKKKMIKQHHIDYLEALHSELPLIGMELQALGIKPPPWIVKKAFEIFDKIDAVLE